MPSASGDIAVDDKSRASLHVHSVLGLNGSTRGIQLLKGSVRSTLEVTVPESIGHLRRRKRSELGIALIDPESERRGSSIPGRENRLHLDRLDLLGKTLVIDGHQR